MSYNYEKINTIRESWGFALATELVGRRVTAVRYMTENEMEQYGWTQSAAVITFDNGIEIIPSRDDEGNGAGTLFTTIKGLETIPTI